MYKRILVLVVLLSSFVFALTAHAQSADNPTPLEIGVFGDGELTSGSTEIYYTVAAEAGEAYVVEMRRSENSSLYSTALRVLNPAGRPVADSSEDISSDLSAVAFVAEESGDYTVVATRGEFSDSTGTFRVRAVQLSALEIGATVEANISNSSFDQYFLLPSGEALNVSYAQADGQFVPTFRVMVADFNGVLRTIATAGAIQGITLSAALETDEDLLYVVAVVASPSDYEFGDVDSNFEITLAGG